MSKRSKVVYLCAWRLRGSACVLTGCAALAAVVRAASLRDAELRQPARAVGYDTAGRAQPLAAVTRETRELLDQKDRHGWP